MTERRLHERKFRRSGSGRRPPASLQERELAADAMTGGWEGSGAGCFERRFSVTDGFLLDSSIEEKGLSEDVDFTTKKKSLHVVI